MTVSRTRNPNPRSSFEQLAQRHEPREPLDRVFGPIVSRRRKLCGKGRGDSMEPAADMGRKFILIEPSALFGVGVDGLYDRAAAPHQLPVRAKPLVLPQPR